MNQSNTNNQPPIFKFLVKHKWRIILPMLFAVFYFALPRYLHQIIAVQQNVFFKSSVMSKAEIHEEFSGIRQQILSDESLKNLIYKYDLYKVERANGITDNILIEKLRNSIEIRLDDELDNHSMFIWIHFREENSQNIAALSKDVMSQFEQNPKIHIDKYVTEPYLASRAKELVLFADIAVRGLFMLSIPLILLWEIPNMFYSPKTKKMVFEPLKADWQEELTDAKLRGETWKAFEINIRYSFAFLAAIIQKSPLGNLFEFFGKFAR